MHMCVCVCVCVCVCDGMCGSLHVGRYTRHVSAVHSYRVPCLRPPRLVLRGVCVVCACMHVRVFECVCECVWERGYVCVCVCVSGLESIGTANLYRGFDTKRKLMCKV